MIEKLHLSDFRNVADRSFDFHERVVIFFGGNGRGKTNILEAISLLSVGRSWRETSASDLIRTGTDSAQISAFTDKKDHFRVQLQPRGRAFFRNEKKLPRKRFFGQIPTLLFAPEHLSLFSGTKRDRQQFFDRFLIQLWPGYREALTRADRASRQKNSLFRQVTQDGVSPRIEDVAPWNEILIETIPEVWRLRTKFLIQLSDPLQHQLSQISHSDDSIEVSLVSPEKFDPTPDGVRDFFTANFSREVAARKSLLSPFRDDFSFSLRERPIVTTASRGEERSVLLALLGAKRSVLQHTRGDEAAPILLLDDCFSELDDDRQAALERLCAGTQAFFTTTHREHFARFTGAVQGVEI